MKKVTMILLYFFCLLFSYCWHLCPSFPIISSYTHINPFTFSKSWEDNCAKTFGVVVGCLQHGGATSDYFILSVFLGYPSVPHCVGFDNMRRSKLGT